MFRLNRNKQKTNRNSLIASKFCYFFYRKFSFFFFFLFFLFFFVYLFFFGLFRNSLFWLFHFYTETESFYVSIVPKQTEDPPKQFKERIFCYFSENLGLFRFVMEQTLQNNFFI
jgi:hypothetical protein